MPSRAYPTPRCFVTSLPSEAAEARSWRVWRFAGYTFAAEPETVMLCLKSPFFDAFSNNAGAMADKTYVCLGSIKLTECFDNNAKSTAPKQAATNLAYWIDRSSKLTTKPPTDKKAKGFYLEGTLALEHKGVKTSIKDDFLAAKSGSHESRVSESLGIEAEIEVKMGTWPEKSMFGAADYTAEFSINDISTQSDSTIATLVRKVVEQAVGGVQLKVIKDLEKRVKEFEKGMK